MELLLESLEKQENKILYKKLMMKYHPDINKSKEAEEITRELIKAKDKGDRTFEDFVSSLTVKKEEPKEENSPKRPARFKNDEDWKKWLKQHERNVQSRVNLQNKIREKQRKDPTFKF